MVGQFSAVSTFAGRPCNL